MMSTAVAYLGYGRHGKCHGATLMGAQKLACQKIKFLFTVPWTSIWGPYFHIQQSCINKAPLRNALSRAFCTSIMTKL